MTRNFFGKLKASHQWIIYHNPIIFAEFLLWRWWMLRVRYSFTFFNCNSIDVPNFSPIVWLLLIIDNNKVTTNFKWARKFSFRWFSFSQLSLLRFVFAMTLPTTSTMISFTKKFWDWASQLDVEDIELEDDEKANK